jgi:hypothetical protein
MEHACLHPQPSGHSSTAQRVWKIFPALKEQREGTHWSRRDVCLLFQVVLRGCHSLPQGDCEGEHGNIRASA